MQFVYLLCFLHFDQSRWQKLQIPILNCSLWDVSSDVSHSIQILSDNVVYFFRGNRKIYIEDIDFSFIFKIPRNLTFDVFIRRYLQRHLSRPLRQIYVDPCRVFNNNFLIPMVMNLLHILLHVGVSDFKIDISEIIFYS